MSPAGGLMGPVRMISSGHELTTDYDEKTLHELGFKDMQVTLVSYKTSFCPIILFCYSSVYSHNWQHVV